MKEPVGEILASINRLEENVAAIRLAAAECNTTIALLRDHVAGIRETDYGIDLAELEELKRKVSELYERAILS
jgi:DNA mismatch repair ATPase MutS